MPRPLPIDLGLPHVRVVWVRIGERTDPRPRGIEPRAVGAIVPLMRLKPVFFPVDEIFDDDGDRGDLCFHDGVLRDGMPVATAGGTARGRGLVVRLVGEKGYAPGCNPNTETKQFLELRA